MIKLIASLEGKGLIRRSIDSENRRVLKVALTASGRRMLTLCEAEIDRTEREIFAPLGATELRQFRDLLMRLVVPHQLAGSTRRTGREPPA